MKQFIYRLLTLVNFKEEERVKIISLGISFFCVIGGYTIIKEMKDALFVSIVGNAYLGKVKLLSMFILIPATLLYAKLVDRMSRLTLLMFYALLYGVGGIVIALVLAHPVVGLANTVASGDRMFGWFIYIFYEGAMPFVVSVCWAYANSITDPATARKGYALIVASSKLGGMFAAIGAYLLFAHHGFGWFMHLSSIGIYQLLLIIASIMLCLAPYYLYRLSVALGHEKLHGYQAVQDHEETHKNEKTGMLSGLFMMVKNPYILGVFGTVFFYESVNVMLGYLRLIVLSNASESIADLTETMFWQRFCFHTLGLLISFFGTRVLVKKLGERVCLILVPLLIAVLLLYFMLAYDKTAVLVVFTILQSVNYSFVVPLRESLYIPTVKDIRFKSKAWIDSFGTKAAKSFSAGVFDILARLNPGSAAFLVGGAAFFSSVLILWVIDAWYLGKKYQKAIDNNEVIGA